MASYELPEDRLYLGGEWVRGRGAEIVSTFSGDGSLNRVLHGASQEDVEFAIARARDALLESKWGTMLPHHRALYLYKIANELELAIDQIAYVQTRDTGKTYAETTALVQSAAATFRYMGAVAETMEDSLTPPRGDYISASRYAPLGIVAGITPWNSPIASDAQKVAPALAAGNAVLLKPASWSPLVCLALARAIERAGLPPGLFSTLPGAGNVVGDFLIEHPDIKKVSFTGGTEVGRSIAAKAGRKLMPVSLELGGKSPTIVFSDADFDVAIAGILFGIFSSTGQSCIAGSRLFIERSVFEPFLERLIAATKALRVGDPFDPATQVAPLIHSQHRDSIESHCADALHDGGELRAGGSRPVGASYDRGEYFLPTIFSGLANDTRLCRTEVFGPVLAVLGFEDEEDLFAQCNDNDYGLACGIFTSDMRRAWRVGHAIAAGTVWVNTYKQFSISTPFSGRKDSGLGLEKGQNGVRAWMAQKSIYFDLSGTPHPWARPRDASPS